MSELRLRIGNDTGIGYKTKIYIDDVDVSECFRGFRIEAGVGTGVVAHLEAPLCALAVDGVEQLHFPMADTRELLIKHGWVPPAEPVTVPVEARKTVPYEPLDFELFAPGAPASGRDLLNMFFERVQREWEPGDGGDTLSINRVYDEAGNPVPGKRSYSLTLTLDTDKDDGSS